VIGDANPDFTLGARGQLRAGRFDASFLVRGVFGQDVLNNTALVYSTKGNALQDKNFLKSALTDPIGITQPAIFSSRWIEDGSFVRLQNVTVGYTFTLPFAWQRGHTTRVYVSGDNLLMKTSYTGTIRGVHLVGPRVARHRLPQLSQSAHRASRRASRLLRRRHHAHDSQPVHPGRSAGAPRGGRWSSPPQGCTDLAEKPFSVITPEVFYKNDDEVRAGLAAVYSQLNTASTGNYRYLNQIPADDEVIPVRGQDWFDNGAHLEAQRHTWQAGSPWRSGPSTARGRRTSPGSPAQTCC
jgi:hypothetical protein